MDKEILNMDEAADFFNVSIKTFIKLLKEEKVPARKIGREWRFSRKALVDWVASGDSQHYSSSEGETREFFNEIAPKWEELSREYFDQSIKNKLIDTGLLNKTMTIVDLGAGDGYISRAVASYVKNVVAVDISAKMLEQLKKKADAENIKNIQTLESDILDMPLADKSVDMVCASMCLHHVQNSEAVVLEMSRVLKKGGFVFIADYNAHRDIELKEKMHDYWMGFDSEEVVSWFKNTGFENIKVEMLRSSSENNNTEGIFVLTARKK